jgi:chromosome segregation ATPase
MATEVTLKQICPQCAGDGVYGGGGENPTLPCNWLDCNQTGYITWGKFIMEPDIAEVLAQLLANLEALSTANDLLLENQQQMLVNQQNHAVTQAKIDAMAEVLNDTKDKVYDNADKLNDIFEWIKQLKKEHQDLQKDHNDFKKDHKDILKKLDDILDLL